MKVVIDYDLCESNAVCMSILPEVFELGALLIDEDILDPTTAFPRFTPDVEGPYILRLEVSDGAATDADNVLVFVDNTPPGLRDHIALL